jgi:hypothetical protein
MLFDIFVYQKNMKKIALLLLLAFLSLNFTAQEKEGFTAEVAAGVGRNLIKGENHDGYYDYQNEIIGSFGISLGYRF